MNEHKDAKTIGHPVMKAPLRSISTSRHDLLPYAAIALGLILAYLRRFVQDDAFISFVYARSLVEGHGLTWFGEHVEGFTNPLWTLLIAAGIRLGFDPVGWSYALGLSCFLGTLLLVNQILRSHVVSPVWVAAGLLILVTNYSFLAYATGGLETMLQTLLLLVCVSLTLRVLDLRRPSVLTNLVLGFAFGLSILNRLDAAIFLSVLSLFLALHFYRTGGAAGTIKWSLQMLIPFCSLVVPFFAWKIAYYGDILPNTYYVKSGVSMPTIARGAIYVAGFVSLYLILPALLIMLLKRKVILAPSNRTRKLILIVSSLCVVWWIYVVKNGGDFMEYRFLVPTLPLLMLGITAVLARSNRLLPIAVFVILLMGNAFAIFATELLGTRWGVLRKGFVSISALDISSEGWDTIGKELGDVFAASPDIVIAVKPAGAIPFYSRLPSIDMFGLNDRWVATQGEYDPNAPPGHQRKATFPYLLMRDVNVVVGYPRTRGRGEPRPTYDLDYVESQFISVPENLRRKACESRMLEIPIASKTLLTVWILTPDSELIGAAVAKHRLSLFPLDCPPE